MNNPEQPMAVLLTQSIMISACSDLWPVQHLSRVTASEGHRLGPVWKTTLPSDGTPAMPLEPIIHSSELE